MTLKRFATRSTLSAPSRLALFTVWARSLAIAELVPSLALSTVSGIFLLSLVNGDLILIEGRFHSGGTPSGRSD